MKFRIICDWHTEHVVEMPDDYDTDCICDDIDNGDSTIMDQLSPEGAELWGWEMEEA